MRYQPPQAIQLTSQEALLFTKIPRVLPFGERDRWLQIEAAIEPLFDSLSDRDAIPEIRISIFSDPNYAEVGKKAPLQVFESNGCCGREILRSPYFVEYLYYFIEGPNLPKPVITGLCNLLSGFIGSSGMEISECKRYAKSAVREAGLEPGKAATEFFRLGVELGLPPWQYNALRNAALSARYDKKRR